MATCLEDKDTTDTITKKFCLHNLMFSHNGATSFKDQEYACNQIKEKCPNAPLKFNFANFLFKNFVVMHCLSQFVLYLDLDHHKSIHILFFAITKLFFNNFVTKNSPIQK